MKMYRTLLMSLIACVFIVSGCTAPYVYVAPPLDISDQCTSLFPVFYGLKSTSCERALSIRARHIIMYNNIITDDDNVSITVKQEQLTAKTWQLIQVLAEAKPELVITCSKEFMDYVNAGTLHVAKCDGIEDVDTLTQQVKDQQKVAEILAEQMQALHDIIYIPAITFSGRMEYDN